ncbi:MAG: HupE/UreJ family protein, partial [Actinobacteria bacterium]|nr:HupE/UreJ family protein [Actinomycetota bacterium]
MSIGQSKIRQDGAAVRYELAVGYDELSRRLETEPAAPGNATDAERKATLLDRRAQLAGYLGREVRVRLGGAACTHRLDEIDLERFEGQVYALLSSTYLCPDKPAGAVEVEYDLFFDALGEAERSSHANVADYDLGGEADRFVFERGEQRLVAGGEGVLSSAGRFAILGLKHILAGLDHVLFVLALLIGARSVRGVVKVATAFTAAHSVTLALAALGWVSVPPSIVEPAIALSIVCVAIQNIVQKEPTHRLVVVFGFGLMHGLGFAGALSFGDAVSWNLIGSLLAFNVGIELGQASVILLATPLLLLARRRRWSRTAQ